MGHTRTPNDVNAHPHTARFGRLAMIHNGIIENYEALRTSLEANGHAFVSDTDTEVLIHLIDEVQSRSNAPIADAVQMALKEVEGAYAIAIIDANEPDLLIAARKSSPSSSEWARRMSFTSLLTRRLSSSTRKTSSTWTTRK